MEFQTIKILISLLLISNLPITISSASTEKKNAEHILEPSNQNIDITDFPFLGSYGQLAQPNKDTWTNDGTVSVLNKRVLMTAAHCIRDHDDLKQVLLGKVII